MKTINELNELINSNKFDFTSSDFLKKALRSEDRRDVVDVLKDIEFLHVYFTAKINHALKENGCENHITASPFAE